MPSRHRMPTRARLRLGIAACVALLAVLGVALLVDRRPGDALARANAVAEGAQAVRQDQFRHLFADSEQRKAEIEGELAGHEAAVESALEPSRDGDGRHVDAAWQGYLDRTRGFLAASRAHGARAAAILDAAAPSWDRLSAAAGAQQAQSRANANADAGATNPVPVLNAAPGFRRTGLTSLPLAALAVLVGVGVWFALRSRAARAAAVDRITRELEARAVQVDEFLRDARAGRVPIEA